MKSISPKNLYCKSVSIIFILIFFFEVESHGQNTSTKNDIVYVEFGGGAVFGISIGYERYLSLDDTKRFTLRGGLGLIDAFSSFTSFFGGSFVYGQKSGLELGMNYLINYDASVFRSVDFGESGFENDLQLLVGYRYQNWKNGWVFRVFYVPPVGCCGTAIPVYAGMSLGYAF